MARGTKAYGVYRLASRLVVVQVDTAGTLQVLEGSRSQALDILDTASAKAKALYGKRPTYLELLPMLPELFTGMVWAQEEAAN